MDFEDLNSCSAKKKRKSRNGKNKALCGSNNSNHEGDSLMQDVLLQKDSCVESTANVCSNSGSIEVQSNSNMNCSDNKNKRKGEKMKRCKGDASLQEVASETKTSSFRIEAPADVSISLVSEKDSCVEPTVTSSSNSGLIEMQSNSDLNFSENKNKRKMEKKKKKRCKALKPDNTYVDLQEVASETKIAPFIIEAPVDVSIKPVTETAPLEVVVPDDLSKKMDIVATSAEIEAGVQSTANVCSNSGSIEVQLNSNMNCSDNKNKRKGEKMKRCKGDASLQEVASETKTSSFRIEAPVDVSISPVSEKDSCMEPTVTSSSNSGLIEMQSNSDLNFSENKNKRKMEKKKKKKKRCKALKPDNTYVDLQEVASETKTAPFIIEAPVDVSIKPVTETAPLEVVVPDDLSKKMDFVAASAEIEAGVQSTANVCSNSGSIEVQLNSNMNCSDDKNKRKGEKMKRCKGDASLQEVASETKTSSFRIEAPVDVSISPVSEKDSCVEPTVTSSSNSGLIEMQSNSDLNFSENKNKRKMEKKKKKKRCKALKPDNTYVDLQEVASETKTAPFIIEAPVDVSIKPVTETAPLEVVVPDDLSKKMDFVAASAEIEAGVESTANVCSNSGSIEVQSNSNRNCSDNKNKRKGEKMKRCKGDASLQEVASETKTSSFRIEAPVDVSISLVSEKDSCVEPTVTSSSNSGLIEMQSNSDLNFSENKNKRKMEKKKKRCKALKPDNTYVDLQEVASETKTAPFIIEAPVDVSIKPVTETAPLEVVVPDDLSKKMDFVAASAEIKAAVDMSTKMDPVTNLSCSQKKRPRRKKKKQSHNSLGHDAINHVHPEDNSVTDNTDLEKDTSSLTSVNMCSEKQPNGQTDSEHNDNEKHYEQKDVKFASAVAELDLTTVKEDLLVSEKKNNSSKMEDTSLLEKHDVHAESVNPYKRKEKVKTYSKNKRRESSDSEENTPDCIKEDGTGLASFDHSEEAHVTGFSEVKLDIELEQKNDASVQVSEDIKMREPSIDCSDGKPVCKDNENRMEMKISKEDEGNLERKNRGELKEIKITVQELSHANGVSIEKSSSLNEKASDSISGFDTFCNHQEQMNAEVETKVEEIFPSSSHLGVTETDVVDVTGKEDNLLQKSHPSPERACIRHCKKKLLVLDVNGILTDIVSYASCEYKPDIMISMKAVFKRPYCDDFLQFCFEKFNVGVWSSRIKKNVEKVVEFLMGDSRHNLLFTWDAYHCTYTGLNTIENKAKPLVLKELKKLWDKLEPNLPWEKGEYNETNTLLLDDSPYKALRNPAHTAIFPYSYEYKDANDSSLGPGGDLRVYLEGLAAADNVQEYVQQNPFGQRAITESNPSWGFYSKLIDAKPSQHHDNSSTS